MTAGTKLDSLALSRVRVRPIEPSERGRWEELMHAHHYLGLGAMVGRSLRYIAEIDGQWLALVGWASAALKCNVRDAWIGWSPTLQWQRIGLLVNNTRFLILPGVRVPNLASRVLSLNLRRLNADWQSAHGAGVLLAETFVDPSRFAGICYKAANWQRLGLTRGFAKTNATYVAHGAAKQIWVYPLHPRACELLRSAQAHAQLPQVEAKPMHLSDTDAQALFARLQNIDDERDRRGKRHSQRSLLAMILCAVISGAQGPSAISEWVDRLSPAMLRRLRCRRDHNGHYERPSEPTIRRKLANIDIAQLEGQLGGWLQSLAPRDEAVALDGKALRGTRANGQAAKVLISALGHRSSVVLNQVACSDKSNEITAVAPLLDSLDLSGRVVTADALHTQTHTARYLVEEKQAHYVFTVKDNQPTLKASIAKLQLESFPPLSTR